MLLLKQKKQAFEKEFEKNLLGFFALFSKLKNRLFIARRHNQKSKRFTILFAVFAVVHIMRIDHSVQVTTAFGRSPANTLMDNKIVENDIENPIKQDSKRY